MRTSEVSAKSTMEGFGAVGLVHGVQGPQVHLRLRRGEGGVWQIVRDVPLDGDEGGPALAPVGGVLPPVPVAPINGPLAPGGGGGGNNEDREEGNPGHGRGGRFSNEERSFMAASFFETRKELGITVSICLLCFKKEIVAVSFPGSYGAVKELFREKFPGRPVPSRYAISYQVKKFRSKRILRNSTIF